MNEDNNNQPTEEQSPSDETQVEYREISIEELRKIFEDSKILVESYRNLINNRNDKPSDRTQAELRKISKEELKQILEDHKKWLESNGKEGKRADIQKVDLAEANLQETNLGEANLQKANLDLANLQKADLNRANLKRACLDRANLHDANLYKTKLQNSNLEDVKGLAEANLQYANLEGATGLLGNEFAQADVTGTKLPDDIKEFKALETVEKTSQNARKIFFAMLLGCVYSWLTIATTTDVRLLTNTASSPLPIIGTEIPIAWFYIAAPLVLICLYFYFHLYLLKLWEGLSGLPAIFPDGKRLDERAYPWLLNGLVRRHFILLKTERPFIAHVQEWITIFLAWWVVPITMIAFWLRYIPRHVWWGTIFHIILIVISFAFAIFFYRLCAFTLKGKEKLAVNLKRFWSDKGFYYFILKIFSYSSFILLVGLLFSLISVNTINGFKAEKHYEPVLENFIFDFHHSLKNYVPWALDKLGYDVFADFREKSVSETPSNYGTIAKDERLEFVNGAELKEANLEYADMYGAFLVKADLRGALLADADLSKSNLQQAKIMGANLQRAIFKEANLQEADLQGANLIEAKFFDAHLFKTNLKHTDFRQGYLFRANLEQANLFRANLLQANLFGANLKEAILGDVILQQANLELANLQKANLQEANLQYANLLEAKLYETILMGADLTGVRNLTIEQLSKTKTLYNAQLDPELLEQVKKCCPHLLEEPKEEKDKKDENKINQ